jgi:hypothetical protein
VVGLSVDRAAMMCLLIGPRRKIHIGPSIIIHPSMAGGSCPWEVNNGNNLRIDSRNGWSTI